MSFVLPPGAPAAPADHGARIHLAGLDGVRAFAVAGVLLYHSDLQWFQGGFLGVDVFFVLSGFLITGLLVREIGRTGGLDIRGFYFRRFRRLAPALVLLLLGTLITAAFFVPDAAARVRADGLASLLYVSNWWLIVSDESYFEFISRPPLLQHLWSLAIEEQFYLLWPLCVYGLMRLTGRRGLGVVALLLSIASTVWMAQLSLARGYPDVDPSRIYFGTDTHCMGLLLGAALAAVWHPWRATVAPSRRADLMLSALGAVSLAGVAFAYVSVGERAPLLYRGGFLLLAVVVCTLIVAASRPGTTFGRLLGMPPLRWMGERSYGLYLWHWPIFVMTRPGLDIPVTGVLNLVLRLALTVIISDLSYRFVERPIREGAIGRFLADWREARSRSRRPLVWRGAAAVVSVTILLALAGVALAISPTVPPDGQVAADVAEAMGISNGGPTKVTIERLAALAPKSSPASASGVMTISADGTASSGSTVSTSGTTAGSIRMNNGGLTAVGDSVLLGARVSLEKAIRGVQVDAEVGRQATGVLQRVRELHAERLLSPTVLVHLGTNGYVTESQIRRALTELGDRQRVIIVNAHAPRRWVPANNDMIARVVQEYPNAVLIDWADVALAHPEFFASDDIHLTASGQRAFAAEVIRAGGFPTQPPPLARAAAIASRKPGGPPPAVPDTTAGAEPPVPAFAEITTPPALATPPPDEAPAADAPEAMVEEMVALVRHPQPMAVDRFWYAMASCETGGDWNNGGQYAGGLGIYVGSWEKWGGLEFAPSPDQATPDQQIVVANRISTQGWIRPDGKPVRPVGFGGWGCSRVVGQPETLTHTIHSVVVQPFTWSQHGEVVRDLQTILGLPRDGVYGPQTWQYHLRLLEQRQLPRTLAPPNPPAAAASVR